MRSWDSAMAAELREAPEAVRRQQDALHAPLAKLVARLARHPPALVMTCARGSSAHAAAFAKHLIERHLSIPVAAAAPSIATVYQRKLRLNGQLFLAISQSGASDDLVEATTMARTAGALTAAIVNEPESTLASACEIVLPMAAGPERSVPASKTFVAALAALLRLTARWSGSAALDGACDRLPERLALAGELDWTAALSSLGHAQNASVIGRGPTLTIAREAALKLKETCSLQAEAFSSAEFRHGPIALVSRGYPVLAFTPTDESALGFPELVADLSGKGAAVFATAPSTAGPGLLPTLPPDRAQADAICLIQSFYVFLVRLAAHRGADIDRPRYLRKVTRTR